MSGGKVGHLCAFFFFNDTATTEIYTLSLHDALPISTARSRTASAAARQVRTDRPVPPGAPPGRGGGHGSTPSRARALAEIGRAHGLNSSHANISYAVFCLKKKTRRYI